MALEVADDPAAAIQVHQARQPVAVLCARAAVDAQRQLAAQSGDAHIGHRGHVAHGQLQRAPAHGAGGERLLGRQGLERRAAPAWRASSGA